MKLHRKIKDNEKVYHIHDLGSYAQAQGHNQVRGQGHNQVRGQNHVLAITFEANLMKLHRTIEHNEKVCWAQELGSTPKVKVTIMSKVKLCLKSCFS